MSGWLVLSASAPVALRDEPQWLISNGLAGLGLLLMHYGIGACWGLCGSLLVPSHRKEEMKDEGLN